MALVYILSVIVVLGILIFVHEFGHFIVAKWCNVGVLKFSFGFGPRIVGKKIGETEYLVSAVPLGGYVKLLGESDDEKELPEEDLERSFAHKPASRRFAIVAAGPVFNFLFAIIAFALVFMLGVPTPTTRVGDVQDETPAASAGIQKGDKIRQIDGKPVKYWEEMASIIRSSEGRPLNVLVEREGEILNVLVVPREVEVTDIFGEIKKSYAIGVVMSDDIVIKRENPFRALISGVDQTWWLTKLVFQSIAKIFQRVVSPKELAGPVFIAKMSGDAAQQGLAPFIYFIAFISVNLAILNLLPIPILDGGHLMFFLVEAVTGREVNRKVREAAQTVGFFLLMLLILWVTFNDILRIRGD